MDIRQLRYFLTIVDEGSLKAAARRLGVRQPSLSQQLANLEDEIGEALVDRLGHGIALTAAGSLLVPRARRLVADATELRRAVRDDLETGKGTLSVGALPTIAPYVLPAVLRAFRATCPDARLVFHERPTHELVERVAKAEIEVALVGTVIDDDRVDFERVHDEPLLLALPADHECAKRERLCAEHLEALGVVVLDEVHCLGDQAKTLCRLSGIDRAVLMEAGQLETALRFVSAGLGMTIIPEMASATARERGLVVRPLVDGAPTRPIGLIRNGCRVTSRLASQFSAIVRDHLTSASPVSA